MATRKRKALDDLYVGIDLGTARSAVTTSSGAAAWDRSLVGWPKDAIARKLLKKDVVYGAECLDHRLALDVFRPLQDGVVRKNTERDEEAIRALAQHLISLVDAEDGQRVQAVIGAPAEASSYNKSLLREAFGELVDASMVVSEPFPVAYGLDMLVDALVVDIGAGTVDLCIMRGTVPTPEDQRTIEQAGDYIDRQLADLLRERFPNAQFTDSMVVKWKEAHAFVGDDPGQKVKVTIPVDGKPTTHDITDEMRTACESILPHLLGEIRELIAAFDPEFQEQVRGNVLLAGGGSQIRGIDRAIEAMLGELGGGKVKAVDDALFAGAKGALEIAKDTPDEDWARLAKGE